VSKWLANRVVMFHGDDAYTRAEAFRALVAAADPGGDGFDREEFVADGSKPADWLGAASQFPFMAERRTVIVRHLARSSPGDEGGRVSAKHPVALLLSQVPESGLLILVADDELGDRDRQERFARNTESWVRLMKYVEHSAVAEFKLQPGDIAKKLRERAEAAGKKLPSDAAQLIVQMVGASMANALSELDKVLLYLGDEQVVRTDYINKVVAAEPEFRAGQLIQAVTKGRAGDAVSQMRQMLADNPTQKGRAGAGAITMLANSFRLMSHARTARDMGENVARPTERLRAALPEKSILNEPDWRVRDAVQNAARFTQEQIQACLNVLLEADATLKGLRPGGREDDTMELMVLRLVQIAQGKESDLRTLVALAGD
jgi:DNA polymerase III subunit delta